MRQTEICVGLFQRVGPQNFDRWPWCPLKSGRQVLVTALWKREWLLVRFVDNSIFHLSELSVKGGRKATSWDATQFFFPQIFYLKTGIRHDPTDRPNKSALFLSKQVSHDAAVCSLETSWNFAVLFTSGSTGLSSSAFQSFLALAETPPDSTQQFWILTNAFYTDTPWPQWPHDTTINLRRSMHHIHHHENHENSLRLHQLPWPLAC